LSHINTSYTTAGFQSHTDQRRKAGEKKKV
jgi:hypothetical protein